MELLVVFVTCRVDAHQLRIARLCSRVAEPMRSGLWELFMGYSLDIFMNHGALWRAAADELVADVFDEQVTWSCN